MRETDSIIRAFGQSPAVRVRNGPKICFAYRKVTVKKDIVYGKQLTTKGGPYAKKYGTKKQRCGKPHIYSSTWCA